MAAEPPRTRRRHVTETTGGGNGDQRAVPNRADEGAAQAQRVALERGGEGAENVGVISGADDGGPAPDIAEAAPNYFSPQADEAAQLIDSMSDELREIALDLVRVLAMHDADDDPDSGITTGRPSVAGLFLHQFLNQMILGIDFITL